MSSTPPLYTEIDKLREENAKLRKIYEQACLVWAAYMTHSSMCDIAVRDLCEMVDRMKMEQKGG